MMEVEKVSVANGETVVHFKDGSELYLSNVYALFMLGTLMQYYDGGHYEAQGEPEHHRIIGILAARIADKDLHI